jgi:hypothetical protein
VDQCTKRFDDKFVVVDVVAQTAVADGVESVLVIDL